MKASEMIKRLQEIIDKHGDLAVHNTGDWDEIRAIYYDAKYSGGIGRIELTDIPEGGYKIRKCEQDEK